MASSYPRDKYSCPDSAVEFLTSRGGEQYLHYLRVVLPGNLQQPVPESIASPHPVWIDIPEAFGIT